jgi:hypothetical protein
MADFFEAWADWVSVLLVLDEVLETAWLSNFYTYPGVSKV